MGEVFATVLLTGIVITFLMKNEKTYMKVNKIKKK